MRRIRILTIDDDPLVSRTIKTGLKRLGKYSVLTALSGKEGLRLATKERPDAVLLDITMPDMDGLEVLRTLRAKRRTRYIPVIMLTALQDVDSVAVANNAYAEQYMMKPFTIAKLDQALTRITTHRPKLLGNPCGVSPRVWFRLVMLRFMSGGRPPVSAMHR
jgi:CheY-like chemotaxis protein